MTVTFSSKLKILVVNTVDITTVSQLDNLGTFTTLGTIPITSGAGTEYSFTNDGVYKISSVTGTPKIVIIFNDIITILENLTKDILLNLDINGTNPNNYDATMLTLLASTILSSIYQLADYSVSNMVDYIELVLAIEQCDNYIDLINNTPQSTNKTWTTT